MTGAASFLAITAVAVVLEDGGCLSLVANRAARASAGVESAHVLGSLFRGQAARSDARGFAKTSIA